MALYFGGFPGLNVSGLALTLLCCSPRGIYHPLLSVAGTAVARLTFKKSALSRYTRIEREGDKKGEEGEGDREKWGRGI